MTYKKITKTDECKKVPQSSFIYLIFHKNICRKLNQVADCVSELVIQEETS